MAIMNTPAILSLFLVVVPALIEAQGDYACVDNKQCATEYFQYIGSNSTCVPDPLHPEYGYCGYIGAPCGTSADCDFGVCNTENRCSGYMGSTCSDDFDCMAYFFCGTDGKCGGGGAKCISGNEGCLSNSCSEKIGSATSGVCSNPPAEGVSIGMACSVDTNCESRSCDSETFLCRQGLALAPSQAARMRAKRDGSSHYNPKERRGKVSSWFRSHGYCATGQTACTTVGGYECIDTSSSLESCGGCPQIYDENATNQIVGTDCTNLPFVNEVYCDNGKCRIVSCVSGTRLSDDGTSCVMRRT